MFFGVLGSLYARGEDGEALPLGGPARRQLLAALVSRVGRTVPASTLVDDLWGEAPPASALKTLQSHVLRLRRDLAAAEDGASVLVTDGPGYRLSAPAEAVDSWCFERDLRLGSEALAHQDPDSARVHLDAAVAWWRGDAYVEFPEPQFAVSERLRLGELRSLAHERRIEARLHLGEDASLVGEIEARLALEPYRERLWQQLLLALYRSGRQAESLTAYRRARTMLIEELGVEPSPVLRDLEARILAQDAALLVPRARASGEAGLGVAPVVTTGRNAPRRGPALCPYPGLSAYGEADAALFVAREKLTARLVGRLADSDLVVLTGPSGSGKSSLVRAGLLPALRGGGLPESTSWRVAVATAQALPARRRSPLDLLVVDHLEELFTLPEAGSLERADTAFADLLAHGTRLVLVLRADFYGRLADLPRLSGRVGAATLLVPPLTEVELRRVIVEPARRVGLDVEGDLVDQVLDDVRGQPGALPLLSAALASTWRNRTDDLLTVAGYHAGGGVRRALETTAESAYLSLADKDREGARRLLVRLATRESGRWTRRPLPRHAVEVDGLVDSTTLTLLAGQRILTVSEDRVELVHEALLDGWPRLRGWLQERAAGAEVAEAVAAGAVRWLSGGRQDADLLRGVRLQAALDWRAGVKHDLLPVERDFLEASDAAARAELLAARARVRQLRRLTAVLATLALLATVGGIVAVRERANARGAALAADARRLAALSVTAPDLRTSLLLAATAYRLQDSPDSRGALLAALTRNDLATWRMPAVNRPQWLGTVDGGRQLWTTDQLGRVHRYDTKTRTVAATFPQRAAAAAALSPDGSQLVVMGSAGFADSIDSRISVLSAIDGHLVAVLPVSTADTFGRRPRTQAVFTGNGKYLSVIDRLGDSVVFFDTSDYSEPVRRIPLHQHVAQLASAHDSVVALTDAGSVAVLRPPSFAVAVLGVYRDLAVPPDSAVVPFVVSRDGHTAALTRPNEPNQPVLLDLKRPGAALRPLDRVQGGNVSLALDPPGTRLAVGSRNGDLTVVRVRDRAVLARQASGVPNSVSELAWVRTAQPNGQLFATGLAGEIRALSLSDGPRLMHQGGPVLPRGTVVVPAGRHLSVARPPSESGQPWQQLDMRTGRPTATFVLPTPAGYEVDLEGLSMNDAGDRLLVSRLKGGVQHGEVIAVPSGRVLSRFVPQQTPSAHGNWYGLISHDGQRAGWITGNNELALLSLPSGRIERRIPVHFPLPGTERHQLGPQGFTPDDRSFLVLDYEFPPYSPPGQPDSPDVPRPGDPPEDQYLGLIDLASGRMVAHLEGLGPGALPYAMAWSPDQRHLALLTSDGALRVLDARTLRVLAGPFHLVGGYANSVSWSPDGAMLITAGIDGSLSFWDPQTLRRIGNPIRWGHVDFSWAWYLPDGTIVGFAPGTHDFESQWFTMPGRPSDWIAEACRLAGENLTATEWATYVGSSRPHQRVC